MKFNRSILVILLALVSMGIIVPETQAARRGYGRSSYSRSRYSRSRRAAPRPATVPQVSTAEVESANLRLLAARAELSRTQRALDQFFLARRSTPGLAAALDELREAQAAHDLADAAVAHSLQGNSEYLAALSRKQEIQRRLDLLRDSGAGNLEQITALATEAMEWGSKATRIQADAENADPLVSETRAKLVAADARVTALSTEASQSVRSDPGWLAAKKARDQAKDNVSAAEAALPGAQQRLASAQSAYDQANLYNRRHGYNNNRSGRSGLR